MKKEMDLFGVLCLYGIFVLVVVIFYSAYMQESKSITLTINEDGEAKSEAFFLVPLVIIFGTFSVVSKVSNYLKDGRKDEKTKE